MSQIALEDIFNACKGNKIFLNKKGEKNPQVLF